MRHPSWRRAFIVVAIAVSAASALALVACSPADEEVSSTSLTAEPIAEHECGVCGMYVGKQSAPRAQVIHRDGERVYLCSLGDFLVHHDAPSPHGKIIAAFVEVALPNRDPTLPDTDPHPWVPASEATYVVGVPRKGIMGRPVLAFEHRADAEAVAAHNPGADAIDFPALRAWWKANAS